MKVAITASIIALCTTFPALSQEKPVIRIATGTSGEPYHQHCEAIRLNLARTADIVCLPTEGSYQNASLLASSEADAAIMQANVPEFWETDENKTLNISPLGETHRESGILLCLKEAGIKDLGSLVSNARNGVAVAIGGVRSGHHISWLNIKTAKPDLARVRTLSFNGDEALLKMQAGKDVTCLFQTVGTASNFMKGANSDSGGKLSLAKTWDRSFSKLTDEKGEPLFFDGTIPDGTFDKLQFGVFSTSYDVFEVPAKLYVRQQFLEQNPALAQQLKRASSDAAIQGK